MSVRYGDLRRFSTGKLPHGLLVDSGGKRSADLPRLAEPGHRALASIFPFKRNALLSFAEQPWPWLLDDCRTCHPSTPEEHRCITSFTQLLYS